MNVHERPQLIVRFQRDLAVPEGDDARELLAETDPQRWRQLVESHGDVSLRPVFTAPEPGALEELQKRAALRDPTYRPEPLGAFFYVDAPDARDLARVGALLREWATVQSAEIEVVGPDPLVNAADDVRSVDQGYLAPAPAGIDARYAWTIAGGDGAGQRIIDVERGWTFDHEDLTSHGISLVHGAVLDTSRAHGTSVFGEMIAVDNTVGCVGIAPNVGSALASSYSTSSIPNAIVAAVATMDFGDVLLLEIQVDVATGAPPQYGPVETIEANYEAIRLATALGIIVVEAGGNGTNNGGTPAVDLDTWQNAAGRRVLWRNPANPDFRDSGAIMMAAASSSTPHTRLAYSTFGARIDCFGWGENVNTLTSSVAGATSNYTGTFGGTSAASPIVAGAALCVQGVSEATQGFRLSPRQMRAVLGDPALNTAPAATETTAMGVMPDLRAIIDNQLDVTPDVYLRDNLADTGEPHLGAVSASPDVILRPALVPDGQAAYGQGSGTELNAALGFQAEAGQDNHIYVRALNQGSTAAGSTTADVFWSPVSTLVTPDLWTFVGTATFAGIPVGETLTVSAPLTWPAGQIPGPGHYCLVAILDTAGDRGPLPADFVNFDNFRRFIRENNNVTWRNFNVVDADPDPAADPKGFVALPFLIAGAPDEPREFALELVLRVPADADVLLECPVRLIRDFDADLKIEEIDQVRDIAVARLPSGGRVRLGPARVGPGMRYPVRLLVRMSAENGSRGRVVARQLLDGAEEVGRVTWVVASGVRKRFDAAKTGDPVGALG